MKWWKKGLTGILIFVVLLLGGIAFLIGTTTGLHLVLNGASDLYVDLLGPDLGRHARAALTQHQLGLDAPVEAELTVEIYP